MSAVTGEQAGLGEQQRAFVVAATSAIVGTNLSVKCLSEESAWKIEVAPIGGFQGCSLFLSK